MSVTAAAQVVRDLLAKHTKSRLKIVQTSAIAELYNNTQQSEETKHKLT